MRFPTGPEVLFWARFYYYIDDIDNCTSADVSSQLFIKSWAAQWPDVNPVDSERADGDLNNTFWCPVAAQLSFTITQLLRTIVAAGAHTHTHTNSHINKQGFLPKVRPAIALHCIQIYSNISDCILCCSLRCSTFEWVRKEFRTSEDSWPPRKGHLITFLCLRDG